MGNEISKRYRTYQSRIKKGHKLYGYFADLCINGNNLYNTTNFYIRQVYTALTQDKPWQPLQTEVMTIMHENIEKMNEVQRKAYLKKEEKENKKPVNERKELKENLFQLPTNEKPFVSYNFLDCLFKVMKQKDYYSLPGQVNQQVMRNVVQNWKSFFASLNDYKKHPEKYQGKPSIPGYMPKGSQKEVILSNQICKLENNKFLKFPKSKARLNIGKLACLEGKFQQVRVIPRYDEIVLEVVFLIGEESVIEAPKKRCMAIDLGLDNLATLVFNIGKNPILIKGGKIKAINQWYNKMRSLYYAALRNGKKPNQGLFHSKRLTNLDSKRHRQIKDLFHKASFQIVKLAKENGIDTIVIGKNDGWKKNINTGKKNNQNFVQVPHSLLVELITYKANAEGIAVVVNEESYTSKASFLDNDIIPTFQAGDNNVYTFSGKRVKRGSYCSKNKQYINADVNGAANILRKVVPNAFANGVAAVCSLPLVVNVR